MAKRSWVVAVVLASGCYEGVDVSVEEQGAEGVELAFPDEVGGEVGHGMFAVGDTMAELAYQHRGGYAVHQGDIILGSLNELTPWEQGAQDVSPAAVRPDREWPGGIVPYDLSAVSAQTRENFLFAANHWEWRTALRFVERTTETAYVRVIEGDGCYSYVGRTGFAQDLSLGEGCNAGSALHEIGHAIGFWHEQSRSDRDAHVTVHWDRIPQELHFAFQTYAEQGYPGADISYYDTLSIMHYSPWAFSPLPGIVPTITRHDGSPFPWQRETLSGSDLAGAYALYGSIFDDGPCFVTLGANDSITRGQSVTSCDGRYVFFLQDDGNLSLTGPNGLRWHAGLGGTDASLFIQQEDGNLVLYGASGTVHWQSGTAGFYGSSFVVQDDGNLVVYSAGGAPLWSSGTYE